MHIRHWQIYKSNHFLHDLSIFKFYQQILVLWLSRNLFLLPKYNKAAESVFLTKYCALRKVISFFHCKIYNHDKLSSDISCQGIEEFEYLPSIRPKFEYIPSIRPKGS